jgi:hypothetical protein
MLTCEEINTAVQAEYPTARPMLNFWAAYKKTNPQDIQEVDAELIGWEVPGVTQPTPAELAALVTKHQDTIKSAQTEQ